MWQVLAFLLMRYCVNRSAVRDSVELERYYTDIVGCLNTAAKQCVPSSKPGLQKFWWTPELDELKQQCIDVVFYGHQLVGLVVPV